jgi:hypothetical protein
LDNREGLTVAADYFACGLFKKPEGLARARKKLEILHIWRESECRLSMVFSMSII